MSRPDAVAAARQPVLAAAAPHVGSAALVKRVRRDEPSRPTPTAARCAPLSHKVAELKRRQGDELAELRAALAAAHGEIIELRRQSGRRSTG